MIRIIIERFIAETLEAIYEDVSKETLQLAIRAPGFISGESLIDIQNPRHHILLCKWQSIEDWQSWVASSERKAMMDKLNILFDKEEKITLLETC